MALDLVTGYKGQNHVTAEQWADFNRGIYGDAAILPIGNKMQVEIQTANQITVKDGTGVFDGRQVYIGYGESENIAIESGTQQMLRHDIVVIKYTKDESSGIENVAFEVVTGVPVASNPQDPAYQDMDIRTGVFTSQKPFCRVRLNGVAIEGVDMLVEVKEFAGHAFSTPAANLTTSEPGRALDATMGKQLKEDVDELNQNLNTEYEKILEITDLTGAGIIPGFRNYKEFVIMISASGYITSHYLAKNMITTPINLQSSYTYESAGSRMAAIRIDANGTYTLAPGMEQNSQNSSVVIYAR